MSSAILLPFLTFGAVVAAIAGIYSIVSDLYLRDRSRVSQRIDDEFRKRQRERVRKAMLFKDLSQRAMEVANEQQGPPTLRDRYLAMVEQSGKDVTPQRWLLVTAIVAVCVGLLAGLARQSLVVGLIGVIVGGSIPLIYLQMVRKQRLEKLLSQLPDAFDLMGRVIRAGQTMSQGLQAVADEFPPPIATEFSYCYEQQNLGLSPELSMRDLARRTGLLEIKIFVTALLVQQQTGGNLAEMLDKLSAIIRQRYRLRGQIKALTAEGRFQAVILLALPIVMFLIFMVMNPAYESELLKHPSLIAATLVCEGIGGLWIRKIVNFDF
jgi:tight adherence protein B